MNKSKIFIFSAVAVVFLALLFYLFSSGGNSVKNSRKFVSDKWEKPYILEDENPLGLHHFKKLVESKSKNRSKIVKDSLETYLDSSSTYFFVGDEFGLHPEEFEKLKAEIENGADLFLSYHQLTDNIYKSFFKESYTEWHYAEKVHVHNFDTTYYLSSVFQTDTIARKWNLFTPENFVDSNYYVHSYMMELPNFVDLQLGKGHIYLHSNPEMFLNHQLLSKEGFAYADFVVNEIKPKNQIKWLEIGRLDPDAGSKSDDKNEDRDENSLLRLIFEQKALTAAFLLTIFGLLLYLIFRTKRYWPTIPYLAKSKNRSLDFADTMTAIYYDQQSPYSLLIVMCKNFQASVNRHFFIDISKEKNDLDVQLLANKSGVDLKELEALTQALKNPKMESITYDYIQDVAWKMRLFYLQTGIIKEKFKRKSELKKVEIKRQMLLAGILIFLGINAFLRGFYLLAKSENSGVILWPVGLIVLFIGIYLSARKLISIDKNLLTWYPYFGKKQVFDIEDIFEIKVGEAPANKGVTFILFTGNRQLKINHFEINKFSQKDFQRFIAPYI